MFILYDKFRSLGWHCYIQKQLLPHRKINQEMKKSSTASFTINVQNKATRAQITTSCPGIFQRKCIVFLFLLAVCSSFPFTCLNNEIRLPYVYSWFDSSAHHFPSQFRPQNLPTSLIFMNSMSTSSRKTLYNTILKIKVKTENKIPSSI